jgi:hypothetical protein
MNKRSLESNSAERPVQFREQDARRIAKAVHAHETSRRPRSPSSLPRAAGGGGGGGVLRAQFTGSWSKGQTKVVTISVSGETTYCNNFIVDVLYDEYSRDCFVAPYSAGSNEINPPEYTLLIPECIR